MATQTVADWLIDWLRRAAERAAEEERRKKLLSREEIDLSQKADRDRQRDDHWCYW